MMYLARCAVASVAAVAVACADPAGSERGTYVLRTVGDSTVPFVEYEYGGSRTIEVADTISLDGRGGAREVSVSRTESAGQPGLTSVFTAPRRYAMHGDTVAFVYTCPPGAACVNPLVGYELVPGGLATFPLQQGVPISFFERIR